MGDCLTTCFSCRKIRLVLIAGNNIGAKKRGSYKNFDTQKAEEDEKLYFMSH